MFDNGRFYTTDALSDWTNFPSKYVLNDALRKVVRLDA